MKTHFASPERATEEKIRFQFNLINESPFISGLLHTVCGLLAVLNENRQIVALNDTFMKLLGIADPKEALGLRPGEALSCIHSDETPGGCGTTRFCATCGAALSIVAALGEREPAERLCALTHEVEGEVVETAFMVSARPVKVDEGRFVLIFLQDVTEQQRRAALERTFFHDVNNMLTVLVQAGELLAAQHPSTLASTVRNTAWRMSREIEIQKLISRPESDRYVIKEERINVGEFLQELLDFFISHPSSRGKLLDFARPESSSVLSADHSLLFRILVNMILNALEASPAGGRVRICTDFPPGGCRFTVHNPGFIPSGIADRIFQRNFSTKDGPGRGFGTYSMKLLGEEFLGGRVSFTSTPENGTEFTFLFPVSKIG